MTLTIKIPIRSQADVEPAYRDVYTGSGLPVVRRLMDEFSIRSSPEGAWIEVRRWEHPG